MWIVDRDYHVATQYTAAGVPLRELGQNLAPSPTCDGRVVRARPFQYANQSRDSIERGPSLWLTVMEIIRCIASRRTALTGSSPWGRQGSGPGEFALVHTSLESIPATAYLIVNGAQERPNTSFDQDGGFQEEWQFANPSGLCIHDDIVYVVELKPFAGAQRGSGRISLWSLDRDLIASGNGSDGDGELMIGPH